MRFAVAAPDGLKLLFLWMLLAVNHLQAQTIVLVRVLAQISPFLLHLEQLLSVVDAGGAAIKHVQGLAAGRLRIFA